MLYTLIHTHIEYKMINRDEKIKYNRKEAHIRENKKKKKITITCCDHDHYHFNFNDLTLLQHNNTDTHTNTYCTYSGNKLSDII